MGRGSRDDSRESRDDSRDEMAVGLEPFLLHHEKSEASQIIFVPFL